MLRIFTPSIHTIRSIVTLVLCVGLLALAVRALPENPYAPHTARAAAITLTGFAWSDTIGWVCFYDASSCPTAGVTINASNNLVGYAWSDTVGWIYFGSNSCGAAPAMNNGALSGYAQATATGGGWDGCIKLADAAAPAYGVTRSGTDLAGFAWGSDTVGWLSFNCADAEPTSNMAILTSGSSWTVPDGISTLSTVECIGGGGSGGATYFPNSAATGGAGAAWAKATNISVTPGSSIAYQIGAGGSGVTAASYTSGNAGTDTWFGGTSFATSWCGAKAGSGGGAYYTTPVNGSGGGSATASRGGIGGGITNPGSTYSRWGGWSGYGNAANTATGGGGAGGPNGDGGQGTNGIANSGTAGGSGGGGSGGAGSAGTTAGNSTAGGSGTEYQSSPAYGSGGGSGGAHLAGSALSGAGGAYGAGSGGAIGSTGASSGKGGNGLVVLTYSAPPNMCSTRNYKVSYNGPTTAPTCTLGTVTPTPAGTGWTITIPYTTAGGVASSGTIRDSSNNVITTTATDSSGNISGTAPTTAGSYTYTLTVSNPVGSNTCTSPSLTVQLDQCTDITGIQQTLPTGCTGPTPSPIGACIPGGYIYNGSICRPQYDYISSFIIVGPSRVRSGNTATLTYTVNNPTGACRITGTNGYDSNTFTPIDGVPGQVTTSTITTRTEFTLSCGTQQVKTVVNITPTFQEQ